MFIRTHVIVLILAILLLAGCGPTPTSELTSAPPNDLPTTTDSAALAATPDGGGTGRIAFSSYSVEDEAIYITDAAGGNAVAVASDLGLLSAISWSPDGTRIAFGCGYCGAGTAMLYVMNADGTGMRELDSRLMQYENPAWSPDGERIAFTSIDEVYSINADGSDLRLLSHDGCCPSWSPDGTQIAFSSDREGDNDIYVMYADGSAVTKLTDDPGSQSYPAWSPDGQHIAYWLLRANQGIYVMDADGGSPTRVADAKPAFGAFHDSLTWSPDGTRLIYTCTSTSQEAMCAINADGSDMKEIVVGPDYSAHGGAWQPLPSLAVSPPTSAPIQTALPTLTPTPLTLPPISPAGRIAFVGHPELTAQILVMNADGTDEIRLTFTPSEDMNPAWSPDGQKLAFVSRRDNDYEIYVMDGNGSNPVNLTHHPADDRFPAWSPDGQMILFTSARDDAGDLFVMNADGSGLAKLGSSSSYDGEGSWSPDGRHIAFSSDRESPPDLMENAFSIFVMNADGSGAINLTPSRESSDRNPVWSPDGTRIAYLSLHYEGDERPSYLKVMNADGSQVTRLAEVPYVDGFANQLAWSPDGTQIAFTLRDEESGLSQIYVIHIDGTGLTRISQNEGEQPAWLPAP